MKTIFSTVFFLAITFPVFSQTMESPNWAKDLIIYEISTKNYTSPNGQGTGTFQSTQEKIPYLADLGINGVWLSGHNWANDGHFFGIWTQYAVIQQDSIDQSLGTREDLKLLVDEFHKHDIKVFLDIITHGVMSNSPLIKEQPEWFKGGSWGMIDFDWFGEHKDLDEWWVRTHVDYVLGQGIDGYRVDIDIYRPDLWKEIKKQCVDAGHPIVVFSEHEILHNNASDFFQRGAKLSGDIGVDSLRLIISNTARFFNDKAETRNQYRVQIHYHDGTTDEGSTVGGGKLFVSKIFEPLIKPTIDKPKVNFEENYIDLLIENIDTSKRIINISIELHYLFYTMRWQLESSAKMWTHMKLGESMHVYLEPYVPDVNYYSVQLSSHDDGWTPHPGEEPFVAEGSRCLFGYSFLFTPAVPLFMSGEEFNASFIPNPKLTPDLYGKKEAGAGTWLYGAVIDWQQVKQKKHREMLEDVKKIISIRKAESDIFHAFRNDTLPDIFELEYKSSDEIPVPFAIQNSDKVIIVAGNNTGNKVECSIIIPLDYLGLQPDKTYTIIDLWNGSQSKIKGEDLKNYSFEIRKDKISKGGIAIYKILKEAK